MVRVPEQEVRVWGSAIQIKTHAAVVNGCEIVCIREFSIVGELTITNDNDIVVCRVAQMVRAVVTNPCVGGSSPPSATNDTFV